MATEKIRAIRIETGESVKSVNELKAEIQNLNKELNSGNLTQEQASRLNEQLADSEKKLASAMEIAGSNSKKLDSSYIQLQERLKQLQQDFKSTNDEMKRADIGKQIESVSTQLHSLQGNLNESNSILGITSKSFAGFGNALSNIGSTGIQSVITGLGGIDAAMTIIEAHPLIAIVVAAVGVLLKVANAIKSNEVAMQRLKEAAAPLTGIFTEIHNILNKIIVKMAEFSAGIIEKMTGGIQALAEKLAALAHTLHMDKIANELDTVVQRMKDAKTVVQEELKIREDTRKINQENVDLQVKLAELEKEKAKNASDSHKAAQIQIQIEETKSQILQNNMEIARREYELIKLKNQQHQATQDELDAESQAYVKAQQAEAAYVNQGAKEFQAKKEEVQALKGSYNDLTKQLAELKEKWKATNDEVERKALGKQILKLNVELTRLDNSIGDYTRNMGDYAMVLQTVGAKGAASIAQGVRLVGNSLKVLYANPIFAFIAVCAAIIMGIVKAIQTNERAVRAITKAFSPLKGIVNFLQNGLDKLTDTLANGLTKAMDFVVDKIKTWATRLANIADRLGADGIAGSLREMVKSMNDQAVVSEKLLAMEEKRRRTAEEVAELEVDLAKARQQFALAEGNANKQRQLAAEIGELDNQIKQKNYTLAKEEYELIKAQNALTQSTQADLNRESEARQRMLQAEAALYDVEREERKVLKMDAREAAKEATELEKLIKRLEDWATKQTENRELSEKELKETYDKEYKMLSGNLEAQKLLQLKYEADLKKIRTDAAKKSMQEINSIQQTALADLNKKYVDLGIEIEQAYQLTGDVRAYNLAIQAKEIQQTQETLQLQDAYILSLQKQKEVMESQGLETIEIERQISQAQLQRAELNLELMEKEQEARERFNDEMYQSLQNSLSILSDYASQIASIGDGISSQWAGVFSKMQQGLTAVQDALKDGQKSWRSYAQIAVASLQVAGQIMSALADEQDENTKEGFEKQKKFQIAAVIMNGAAGILQSWVSAMNPANAWMTIWGQIAMGGVMSALIGAMMGIQLAQIQKTQFGGGNASAATASPNVAGTLAAPVQYTSEVASAFTEDSINDTKVYVVESDITDSQNRVALAESESRY